MEFDNDNMLTPESLELLIEFERAERRASESHAHNMDVGQIQSLGRQIAEHCLKAVSGNRDLIESEGALNAEIAGFLKRSGHKLQKRDSKGNLYHRSIDAGKQIAESKPGPNESTDVISDLVVNERGERVELKTAAFATSKDRVPDDLFDKDLDYLDRATYGNDLERYQWEGLGRTERLAELVIFVADKKIAQGSQRLRSMFGDIGAGNHNASATCTGVAFEIRVGKYAAGEVLEVQRSRPVRIDEFIVLLAYPSHQH